MASEEIHSKHRTYDDDDDGSGSPPAEDDSGDDDMELCMFRLSLCDAKLPMFDNEDDPHLNNQNYQYESGDADGELSEKNDVLENNDDDYGDDDGDDIADDGLTSQERDHHHESMPTTSDNGRCMLMDMDEMKACRDLGFEVKRMSSFSSTDTSSAASSPITNWRISSPGDDPGDVKARLRVWAQVVAADSTARLYS